MLINVKVAARERRFTKLHIAEAATGARLLTNVDIEKGPKAPRSAGHSPKTAWPVRGPDLIKPEVEETRRRP